MTQAELIARALAQAETWVVREPLGTDGRWRIVRDGLVVDSRPSEASATRRMRDLIRKRVG